MTDRKPFTTVEKQGEVPPMVERVARAICRATDLGSPDDWEEDRQGNRTYNWEVCIPSARAAIEAMREPTGKMVSAGVKHENWSDYGAVRSIYGAMIDAALEEGE